MNSKSYIIIYFWIIFGLSTSYVVAQEHSFLIDLPPQTWYECPNSEMRSVCPSEPPGIFQGTGDCSAVINAWSGGAYDPIHKKLIVWGGGHNDYYGNELYAFDIDSMRWELLTEPSVPESPVNCAEVLSDGRPNSRHTYGGLAYLTHANLFFAHGGSLACYDGSSSTKTWAFNLDTTTWIDLNPPGPWPSWDVLDEYCVYDTVSQLVYIFWHSELYSYDFNKNEWSLLNDDQLGWLARGCTIDYKRGLLVEVGNGIVAVFDIRNKNYLREVWSTSGGESIVNAYAPGVDYDPVADRVIGWEGDAVYSLDMDTRTWDKFDVPGAPSRSSNGIFGRFRYLPGYNIFIAITSVDENVHFYKNTAGGISGLNPTKSSNISDFYVSNQHGKAIINWRVINNPEIFSIEIIRREKEKAVLLNRIQRHGNDSLFLEGICVDERPWLAVQYKMVLYNSNHEVIEDRLVGNSAPFISEFSLTDPYPNPSNGPSNFVFQSPERVEIKFTIYDVLGRMVKEFETIQNHKGWKQVVWDGTDMHGNIVSKGIYIMQVSAFSVSNPNKILWQETKRVSRIR